MESSRLAVLITFLLAAAFVAGTYAVPLLHDAGSPWAGRLHWAYGPLCHQLPERSIAVGAGVQAVCSRCSGLYLGGLAALAFGGFALSGLARRIRPIWLLWALAPTAVDALLPWIGIPGLPNLPRLLLALPAGFVAGLFLAAGVGELVSRSRNERPNPLEEANA